ncbi:MAG: hypothetical protein AAF614_18675 [Chloroflexota bacterium]
MTTSIQPPAKTAQGPSVEQLARATQRKRFNWLFVYLPIILAVIGVVTLTVLMVVGVLSPMPEASQAFVSSLADLIIILVTLPLALVCGAIPLGLVGFLIYRRQQQPAQPQTDDEMAKYGRLQKLFWKVEDLIVKSGNKSDELLPKVAQPLIRGNAFFTYIETLLYHIKQFLARSNDGKQ